MFCVAEATVNVAEVAVVNETAWLAAPAAPPPPLGVLQFALPAASMPVANIEPVHCVGEAANALAVAALPPMFRLATGVVLVTVNGAVPVLMVDTNTGAD